MPPVARAKPRPKARSGTAAPPVASSSVVAPASSSPPPHLEPVAYRKASPLKQQQPSAQQPFQLLSSSPPIVDEASSSYASLQPPPPPPCTLPCNNSSGSDAAGPSHAVSAFAVLPRRSDVNGAAPSASSTSLMPSAGAPHTSSGSTYRSPSPVAPPPRVLTAAERLEAVRAAKKDREDDDFFSMRKRRRQPDPPKVLGLLPLDLHDSDEDDDSNSETGGRSDGEGAGGKRRSRKRRTQAQRELDLLPEWTRQDPARKQRESQARETSQPDVLDDSDDDFSFSMSQQDVSLASRYGAARKEKNKGAAGKRAKTRNGECNSKSPELTPPPDPDRLVLEQARRLVQNRLHGASTKTEAETVKEKDNEDDEDIEWQPNPTSDARAGIAPKPSAGRKGHSGRIGGVALNATPEPQGSTRASAGLPGVELVEALDPELALLYRGARADEIRRRAADQQRQRDTEAQRRRAEEITRSREHPIVVDGSDDDDVVAPSAPAPAPAAPAPVAPVAATRQTRSKAAGGKEKGKKAAAAAAEDSDDSIEFVPYKATASAAVTADASAERSPSAGAASEAAAAAAPAADNADRLNILLKGGPGGALEINVRPRPTTLISTLLNHAVTTWKNEIPPHAVAGARIVYDGETLTGPTSLEGAGIEDEEYLEVRW